MSRKRKKADTAKLPAEDASKKPAKEELSDHELDRVTGGAFIGVDTTQTQIIETASLTQVTDLMPLTELDKSSPVYIKLTHD